jgi:hypothetical protein
MFDEIPELKYEKIGSNYVGSAANDDGTIIASEFLKWERFGNAFAGRELTLKMKDGSIEKIKDHWFDCGSYKEHGEFIDIGAGTLERLQDCFVFFGYNINKEAFSKMVQEYLARDRFYEYRELEEWCNLQYDWYDVIVNGKFIPYLMNKKGDMIEKESKKRVYPRYNVIKNVNGKYKEYTYFKFKYIDKDGKLIRIEANYLNTLKATLPFSEEEIKKNCKLK